MKWSFLLVLQLLIVHVRVFAQWPTQGQYWYELGFTPSWVLFHDGEERQRALMREQHVKLWVQYHTMFSPDTLVKIGESRYDGCGNLLMYRLIDPHDSLKSFELYVFAYNNRGQLIERRDSGAKQESGVCVVFVICTLTKNTAGDNSRAGSSNHSQQSLFS